MAWKEWQEGTTTEVLYGAHLNGNFQYLTDALDGGIVAANLSADCVGAGAVAADVIGESHMDWADTNDSPKVLQVGKSTNTYQQWMCRGTVAVGTVAGKVQTVTITYAGAGVCTAGEPTFAAVPHVLPFVYTTDTTISVVVATAATGTAQLHIMRTGGNIETALVAHWVAFGDVA